MRLPTARISCFHRVRRQGGRGGMRLPTARISGFHRVPRQGGRGGMRLPTARMSGLHRVRRQGGRGGMRPITEPVCVYIYNVFVIVRVRGIFYHISCHH